MKKYKITDEGLTLYQRQHLAKNPDYLSQDYIISILSETEAISVDEIREALNLLFGISPKKANVIAMLCRLTDEGKIVRPMRGTYKLPTKKG